MAEDVYYPLKADTDGDGDPDESELDGRGVTWWAVQKAGSAPAGDGGSGGSCGALGIELILILLARKLLR